VTGLNFGPPVTAWASPIGSMECGWYGSSPNGTSLHHLKLRHWWRTFLGTYHAILWCSVGYFQEVQQAISYSSVVQL